MNGRMLITGGQGMLATDLASEAQGNGLGVSTLSHAQLDVGDSHQVRDALQGLHPDYVVHTAGLGVDYTQLHPEDGYRVHTWAAGSLARCCESIGATLVYISTCGLFGDDIRFYSEYDPVTLKTLYSRSKYLGEKEVQGNCRRFFVVRCGWLFGGSPSHSRNFVYQRYLEAKRSSSVKSAGDKYGSPTYTRDLSHQMLKLMDTEEHGVYHVTNQGGGSRYEYVRHIVKAFGLPTTVEEVDSSAFPRPVETPASEMLDNLNLKFIGLELAEPWQDAICRYVAELQSRGVC